jgi:hypothetical protein
MPAPDFLPPADMPAPDFGARARNWTVTLDRGGESVQQLVPHALAPTWQGSMLVFRNRKRKVVARFSQDEVVDYSSA